MSGELRKEFEKEMGRKMNLVVLLWKEKEYAEALLEHLTLKYNWAFVLTDVLDEDAETADLILAEEGWFDVIREREQLWNKTIFLLESCPCEEPLTRDEFPFLVWKYDGFSKIRRRISDAMERLCGEQCMTDGELPPMIILGAWDGNEEECREMAEALAGRTEKNVLYVNLEKFSSREEEDDLQTEYMLEDLLYFALDRMELEGLSPHISVRGALQVRNGACFLPEFQGLNPLSSLEEYQWKRLMKILCKASGASAVLVWTGREEMDHCRPFGGQVTQCIYLEPRELEGRDKLRWDKLMYWLENEGTAMLRIEIEKARSWTEVFGRVMEFGTELA